MKPISFEVLDFDRWLFTGFVYRLGFIIAALYMFLHKKYHSGVFVYVFAGALLSMSAGGFRGQPFFVMAMVVIRGLITQEWWPQALSRPLQYARLVTVALLVLTNLWVSGRVVAFSVEHWQSFLPNNNFSLYVSEAFRMSKLACKQEDVYIIDYPGGTYSYWFTEMPPVSKYIYMWPWVAEVGLDETIKDLQSHPLVIVNRTNAIIWGNYDPRIYLRPLDQFLEKNYVRVGPDTFISPELNRRCNLSSKSP